MRHRGAEGADNKTGDGAGIMLQIPHEFILLQGIPVPEKGKYGTGLLFLPKDGKDQAVILSVIIEEIEKEGLTLMHLRNVPTCPGNIGRSGSCQRTGHQANFHHRIYGKRNRRPQTLYNKEKDREQNTQVGHPHPRGFLHRLALYEEHRLQGHALFLAVAQLLPRPHQQLLHQRTGIGALPFQHQHFPHLGLAQPSACWQHNGEINTIRGNRGWMEARESVLSSRPGRHPGDTPHRATGHERQCLTGQCARVSHHVGPEPAARHGHARTGILQRKESHQRRFESFL